MNLSLIDAFGKFGAKPTNRLRGVSAMAADGAMVLNCQQGHFAHPSRGVLRYEDWVSKASADSRDAQLLGQHLTFARDGGLPVRMVVTSIVDEKTGSRRCHVRTDLIGKVVTFDGDRFVIDFARAEAMHQAVTATHGGRK